MSRGSNQEIARQRRAVFAVFGVLVLVALALYATGGDDEGGLARFITDRETRQGELADVGLRHRRHDGGTFDRVSDAGTFAAHHDLPPAIDDPQIPGPESDPGTSDPGPGAEFIELYQGRSGRLSPQASIHSTRTSLPVRSRMAPPNVLTWTPSQIVSAGDNVIIYAMVRGRHSEDITPDTIEVTIVNGADPSTGTAMSMNRADEGYTYTYVPTTDAHPIAQGAAPPLVSFLVRATGTYEGESYSRSATGTFNVHAPGARLDTTRAQAQQQGSDITVTVPVMIATPGSYYGLAELWGGDDGDQPVAFARDSEQFAQAGEETFTFLFGGAVIRASGIDGPYMVRNVRFMQVDTIPPHQQAPTEELLTTPGWHASDFH